MVHHDNISPYTTHWAGNRRIFVDCPAIHTDKGNDAHIYTKDTYDYADIATDYPMDDKYVYRILELSHGNHDKHAIEIRLQTEKKT